jgi:Ser/Thr protein kinase RdoA (MazF antagonist)
VLDSSHAGAVAARFALGGDPRLAGPVAFGRQGEIWRLDTDRGAFAVKQSRIAPDPDEAEHDAAFQELVHAAGVPTPAVVRDLEGRVVAEVAGVALRVYSWVDVAAEDRRLDPVAVGRLLAAMHAVHVPAGVPVEGWYADPVGRAAWEGLVTRLSDAGAPFATRLDELVPTLLEVEGILVAPTDGLQVCHRDVWADNLRAVPGGGLLIFDWENAGAASPSQELGVAAYEYGVGDPERVRALHQAYVDAGGPGRLREPADLTMLSAQLAHILQLGCERWLAATTDTDRDDNARWVAEFLDDPVTVPVVEELLAAVR